MDAFSTIRHARALRDRHPDAPRTAAHILLLLATYANGRTGSSIRPGHALIGQHTGLGRNAVRLALRWLEAHGELRCDKRGHNGSAAHYSILGLTEVGARGESVGAQRGAPYNQTNGESLRDSQPGSGQSSYRRCPYCDSSKVTRVDYDYAPYECKGCQTLIKLEDVPVGWPV